MEIIVQGIAELIVRQLVEKGDFPSAESAVNTLIVQAVPKETVTDLRQRRLPDPPLSYDDSFILPEVPRRFTAPVVAMKTAPRRLPEFLDLD